MAVSSADGALLLGAALTVAALIWPGTSGRFPDATSGVGARAEAPSGADGGGIPPSPGDSAVAATMELLALVLASGGGLVDAVEAVARTSPGRVGAHLTLVATAVRWGMPWPVAWAAVGPAWAPARRAMGLAGAAGAGPSTALRRAAADVRAAQVQQLELAAARVGVSIVLPLGLAFLPAFVLLTVVPLIIALAGVLWV